jgi:hypothetical protein
LSGEKAHRSARGADALCGGGRQFVGAVSVLQVGGLNNSEPLGFPAKLPSDGYEIAVVEIGQPDCANLRFVASPAGDIEKRDLPFQAAGLADELSRPRFKLFNLCRISARAPNLYGGLVKPHSLAPKRGALFDHLKQGGIVDELLRC